jgi:hypothetical protein
MINMNYYITENGLESFSGIWKGKIISKKNIDRGRLPLPDICNKNDCRGSFKGYCVKKLFNDGLIDEIKVY